MTAQRLLNVWARRTQNGSRAPARHYKDTTGRVCPQFLWITTWLLRAVRLQDHYCVHPVPRTAGGDLQTPLVRRPDCPPAFPGHPGNLNGVPKKMPRPANRNGASRRCARKRGAQLASNCLASATSRLSPASLSTSSPESGMSPDVDWDTAIFLPMSLRQSICVLPA